VVLGVGGVDFCRRAFVDLDTDALNSDTMIAALETFKRIKQYTDEGASGRDWNLATAMVINGKAGMQFMGDWAKGEFTAAGQIAGKD
jgi:glucose/mannose transport system substrate-binding protein